MIEWYYHEPGTGRVGPLSADELRRRFGERRIQRDTLLWHDGLPEWQPLERMAAEIGLESLHVDTSRPPPLPVGEAVPPPASPGMHPATRGKYSRAPLRQKKTLPTAVIVLVAVALVGIPGLLVLGSVVAPAYQDYAWRVTRTAAMQGLADGLKQLTGDYALQTGRCPGNDDARMAQMRSEVRRRFSLEVRFAAIDGGCAFELAVDADGKAIDGKTLEYRGYREGDEFAWECSGGTLPEEYRPHECRTQG